MTKEHVFKGTITYYKILKNSFNGGPRYQVVITGETGTLSGKTQTDNSIGYKLMNFRGIVATFQYHYTATGNVVITDVR